MGLSKYWDYLYNPRSDSWEVISNQAFSTKEVAEEYLKEHQKSQEDKKDIEWAQTMKLGGFDKFQDWLHGRTEQDKINAEKALQFDETRRNLNESEQENKQLIKTTNELEAELYKRGLMIGEKDDKIKQLKEELETIKWKNLIDWQIAELSELVGKK